MGEPHGIGIVGVGNISRQYLATLADVEDVKIVAIADVDADRASSVADGIGAVALTVDELVEHSSVGTVLNLTIPAAHAEVALRAIAAGKDVYGEKPLAATLDQARSVMDAAKAAGVRVGSAPDTVLGTGIQTARAAIESGLLGRPLAGSATWIARGHEHWHPAPDFYYQEGGGPLLDMGPYYLTSLVHLLGPVVSVSGAATRGRTSRTIATGPRAGASIPVEVDTHISGLLWHASGAISTITMSFEGIHTTSAPLEVHGELGSIAAPDPNRFDGETRLWRGDGRDEEALPDSAGFENAGRGVGLLEFVRSPDTPGRASGALGLHVLEIMDALLASNGERRKLTTTTAVPDLVPLTTEPNWRGR